MDILVREEVSTNFEEFSIKEVLEASDLTKEKKAPGLDRILPESVKTVVAVNPQVMLN